MKHRTITESEFFRRLEILSKVKPDECEMYDALDRVRYRLKNQENAADSSLRGSVFKFRKFAAAAVFIIAALAGLYLLVPFNGNSKKVFAGNIQETIFDSESVMFTVISNPGTENERIYRRMALEPGYTRVFCEDYIGVSDAASGKTLDLYIGDKLAALYKYKGHDLPSPFVYFDWVSDICSVEGVFLREEYVGDFKCDVLDYRTDHKQILLWVDKDFYPRKIKTVQRAKDYDFSLPKLTIGTEELGLEGRKYYTFAASGSYEKDEVKVMHDFVWNSGLDKHLFNMEVPDDFKLDEHTVQARNDVEESLIEVVEKWAKFNDWDLSRDVAELSKPEVLKDFMIFHYEDLEGDDVFGKINDCYRDVTKVLQLIRDQMANATWDYCGDGIRLKDAGKEICRWRDENTGLLKALNSELKIRVRGSVGDN